MYACIEQTSYWAALYFVMLVLIGPYMILNLYLSVLINSFQAKVEVHTPPAVATAPSAESSLKSTSEFTDKKIGRETDKLQKSRKIVRVQAYLTHLKNSKQAELDKRIFSKHPSFQHDSLPWFPPTSPFRIMAARIALSPAFDKLVLLVISFSCLLLALDSPDEPAEGLKYFLALMDRVMTGVFVTEFLLKRVAFGFFVHPGSYMRDSWNMLDFLIVVSELSDYMYISYRSPALH